MSLHTRQSGCQPRLKLVVIRTADLDQLICFYTCLGIEFTHHRHGSGPFHAAADLDGVVFEIYPAKKPEDVDRTTRLGFSVLELEASIASIRSSGMTVVEEPQMTEWGLKSGRS